jgi:hypothetical protein
MLHQKIELARQLLNAQNLESNEEGQGGVYLGGGALLLIIIVVLLVLVL